MSGSGISWAICMSAPRSRQITMPVPHHSVFYRPDALPAAQPNSVKVLLLLLLLLQQFNSLFSTTIWFSQYQKGKASLDLNLETDDGVLGWQRHQLDHMQTICTSL